jgi:hypothetical protein
MGDYSSNGNLIAERVVFAELGNLTTDITGGGGKTKLIDYKSGGSDTSPIDGKNTVLKAELSATADNTDNPSMAALDDVIFPQIIATSTVLSYSGDLCLGDQAGDCGANTWTDDLMDGLLAGSDILKLTTTSGNIYLDRVDPFVTLDGTKSLTLITESGYITDNSDTLAFQTSGALTLQSTGQIGIDNGTNNTDGTLLIDVGSLTVTSTGGSNDVHITNAGSYDTIYSINADGLGSFGNVTLVQQDNNFLIDVIETTGDIYLTAQYATAGGAILDNTADDTDANVTTSDTGTITLYADKGIGTGANGSVALDAGTVDAESAEGGVVLTIWDGDNLGVDITADASTSGDVTIDTASGTGEFTIYGLNASEGSVSFATTTGDITLLGAVAADSVAVGGTGTVTLDAGTGSLDTGGQSVSADTGTITLTADTIDLGGTPGAISGAGSLAIAPTTASSDIGIGDGAAGAFNITATELASIANGFTDITIGHASGTGAVDIQTATFYDPVTIQSPTSGSITVNGQITGSDDATITLDSSGGTTALNADIVTAGNAIDISDGSADVEIGNGLSVLLDTTNSGAVTTGAAVTIQGPLDGDTLSGDGGETLSVNAGSTGTVQFLDSVGFNQSLNLTITDSGSTTFSSDVSAGTINLADTTGTIAFQDNLTADALTTADNGYNVSITGAVNNIDGDTNFLNTGTVTIGDLNTDSTTFADGLATTGNLSNPGTVNIAGSVITTGAQMDLGAVTLTDNTVLDTGTAATSIMNVGAVTGAGNNLTLDSGANADITVTSFDGGGNLRVTDSGGTTFTGTVNAGTVELTNTTGTVAFNGAVTADTLTTSAQGYNVAINQGGTITNATTFSNTGTVTIGDENTDDMTFTGGLTSTTPDTFLAGTVNTGNQAISLGNVTLTDSVALDTDTGSGNVTFSGTLDGTTDHTENLTVDAGTGNVAFINKVGTSAALGEVLINSGGGLRIDSGGATIGVDEASSDDTFLAKSLTATMTGVINIGDNADGLGGDLILLGDAAPDYMAVDLQTSSGAANGIVINANIVALDGDIRLETTDATGSNITIDVQGLPTVGAWPATPAERVIYAVNGDVTMATAGAGITRLLDSETGADPSTPDDGKNTVVIGNTVDLTNVQIGSNISDSLFPQIDATTLVMSYNVDLFLGTDAFAAPGIGTFSDTQMDDLLGSSDTLAMTTSEDIVLDRLNPVFAAGDGTNSVSLTAGGYITDNSDGGLALQSTGSMTLEAGLGIGVDNPGGGNTLGTLDIDVGSLTVVSSGGNPINITNAGSYSPNINIVTDTGDVTYLQSSNNFTVDAISTTGIVSLTAAANVSQTGAITAGTLTLAGAGATYTLTDPTNNVAFLDGDTDTLGGLDYSDTDNFTVTGIDAGANNVTLTTSGTLNQTEAITAGTLTLNGGGTYTLGNVSNEVVTLDVDSAPLGGNMTFRDDTGFQVTAIDGGTNNITLASDGTVTQSGAITTTGVLRLMSNGGLGTAQFWLYGANNSVGTLDADNTLLDDVYLWNDSSFTVDGINADDTVYLISSGIVS